MIAKRKFPWGFTVILVVLLGVLLVFGMVAYRQFVAPWVAYEATTTAMAQAQTVIAGLTVTAVAAAPATVFPAAPTATLGPPTLTPTIALTPTITLTPTLGSSWCTNRWTENCWPTWVDIRIAFVYQKAAFAKYGVGWVNLPTTEPRTVPVTGSWWMTSCPSGIGTDGGCTSPWAGVIYIDPKRDEVPTAWVLVDNGECTVVILRPCGNLAWRCVGEPVPTSTPRPEETQPPQPTEPAAATLYLSVAPNPNVGPAPLTSAVTLAVSGTASGQIHYWLDCTNNGSWEYDFSSSSPTEILSCIFPNAGNYTVLGKVSRQGLTVIGNANVIAQ